MPPRFSVTGAFASGFSLVRRHPLACFVWGALFAAAYVPLIPLYATFFSAIGDIESDGPPPPEFFQFQLLSGPLSILQILAALVVTTAIYRAVLRPAPRDRWFFLRLGMDELRVAVAFIAMVVGLYAGVFIIVLIGFAAGFAAHSAESVIGWVVFGVFIAAALVALMLGYLRVCLILPACVLYRDFAFAQGWALGRGQVARLLGLSLLLMALGIAVYMVVIVIVLMLVGGGALLAGNWFSAMAADWSEMESVQPNWPLIWGCVALGFAPVSMIYGVFMAVGYAPYADAARQIAQAQDLIPSPAADNGSGFAL